MCGFKDFIEPVLDVGATLTGNPELIPLINGGVSTAEGLVSGKGIGQSLEGGLISGGESLAGQEVAGAFGIGGGNSAVNNALGIDISPASTGLPDIGSGVQNSLGLGDSGSPSTGSGTGTNLPSGTSTPGVGPAAPAAPTAGGTPGVTPAPSGVGAGGGGDVTFDTGGQFSGGGGSAGSGAGGIDSALSSNLTGPPGANFGSTTSSPGGDSFVNGTSAGAGNIGQGPTVGAAASGGGGAASSAPNSISTAFKDPSLSNIGKALGNNAGALTSLAGFGNDIINSGPLPGEKQLKGQAENLGAQGQQLQGYLNSGTLPPGVQGGITSAAQSAKAAIKSKYAQMGMSGSSAEQQDLASVDTNAATQGTNIALQLLQQGVNETSLSSQIYQELIKNSMANDENFSKALTSLGSAVGGGQGGSGTTIHIGGS